MKPLFIFLRCVSCVVIIFLVLELCARTDDALTFGAAFWGAYNDQVLYTIDKIGKWGKPGARYERWQLNSLGYRGPELSLGTIRIVCFGASETFGLYEDPNEEYPRQLERKLNAMAGSDVFQVVNAAYPGETLPTAILRVPQVVSQVHPSYALIYPALANYISIAPSSAVVGSSQPPEALSDRIFDLRIADRIRNLLKAALPQVIQTKLRQREIARESASEQVMDRLPEENVVRFRKDLTDLLAALRNRNVEPVLVTHATVCGTMLSQRDHDLLTAWRKFYPMLQESGFIDMEQRMNRVIGETANRENIPLIDVENEIPHRPEYFADFVHFTTAGATVMASDLADGLKPVVFARPQTQTALPSRNVRPQIPGNGRKQELTQ